MTDTAAPPAAARPPAAGPPVGLPTLQISGRPLATGLDL